MPRSTRHKSHKQSKHKEAAKDYYSDSDEDVKMKMKETSNISKEDGSGGGGGGSVRFKDSGHSASGEKRKLSSSLQLKEGKDSGHSASGEKRQLSSSLQLKEGKDLGNGDAAASEEYISSSKRLKEKLEGGSRTGSDRWNDGGGGDANVDVVGLDNKEMKVESSRNDLEKGYKSKESKGSGDSKSKSSRRHESGGEKEEKEEGGRSESKRKSEKESGPKESKEVKEKERGYAKDKKGQESKREEEVRGPDGEVVVKKQASQLEDAVEDRPSKRSREITEVAIQDESRNPVLEKELEKRVRRRRESSSDRDRYQDARESDVKHPTCRFDPAKAGKYKDERYKDGGFGDKYQDAVEKDDRHRDEKYRDDAEKYRDGKYHEDVDRDDKRRDDKYHEEGERDNRRREDKYLEDVDRDDRHRDDKYQEDGERDGRRREDRYREVSGRDKKRRDDKFRKDGDKDSRRDNRYYEGAERDDRHRDDKYREDGDRYKEDKRREDYEREGRSRESRQGDDVDREKRLKEAKYKDERSSRDRSSDKPDAKNIREEGHPSELHSRKTSIRDGSPNHDDRARTKDDQGRKRSSDKEDQTDVRSRTTKDQRYDSEKRSSSSTRVGLITDRGRSYTRKADRELTPSRSRHQGSPNSVTRDHYRVSKQDDPKYRDYAYEERGRHSITSIREHGSAAGLNDKISSSCSTEKVVQKDDGHLGDSSTERRLKLDTQTSPRNLIDKSPSSASSERRHLTRFDVRRSIDVEESGQRSGGYPKDYSGKESGRSHGATMETLAADELSRGDGDTSFISSPFARPNHLSGNSNSHLPPLFRTTVDSPANFGYSEDDSRMKFGNRHRRISDPNQGRMPASPWKGVPNWPSPVANGFMPFQQGPPLGFHPVMPQFPPPMFAVRPSMELNHHGVPYHITDGDRFSVHGRPMGWRNPVDDSMPPPLHGWDTNSAAFCDESHLYGRPDWEHGRNTPSGRGWETSGDMWKGPKGDASLELPPASDKENRFTYGLMNVASANQSSHQAKIEQVQPDDSSENREIIQSKDASEKKIPRVVIPTLETIDVPKILPEDDARVCHVYLSMIDISAELADPELYSKCTGLIDDKKISSPEHSKVFVVEDVANAKQKNPSSDSSSSLFATLGDSLFQKAMTLYKRERESFTFPPTTENSAFFSMQNLTFLESDKDKQNSEDKKSEELVPAGDATQTGDDDDVIANSDMEVQLAEASTDASQRLDETVISNVLEKPEEATDNTNMDEDEKVNDPEVQNGVTESDLPLENAEPCGDNLPARIEEVILPGNSMEHEEDAGRNEVETMADDTKYGNLVLSESPSKACEVEMVESIESESVNLSRIP